MKMKSLLNHRIVKTKRAVVNGNKTNDTWVLIRERQQWPSLPDVAKIFNISESTLYEFIKAEPTFPYRNIGIKKKYQINIIGMVEWLVKRTEKEKQQVMNIPSGADLLRRRRI